MQTETELQLPLLLGSMTTHDKDISVHWMRVTVILNVWITSKHMQMCSFENNTRLFVKPDERNKK